MLKTKVNKIIGALVLSLSLMSPAISAEYPEHALTIICSHGQGGDTDFNTRLLSKYLASELGLTINIQNVTGANGSIAMKEFLDQQADGYTLLATNTMALASNEAAGIINFGYNAFEPIAIFGRQSGENIIVNAKSPYTSLDELITQSQNTPNKIKLGVAMGGSSFLSSLILEHDKGAKFAMFDAGGDASGRLKALLTKHVDVTIVPYALAKKYIDQGEVRALATLMSNRLMAASEIPTAQECGVKNLVIDTFYALFAPKGTDPSIVDKINHAIEKVVTQNSAYQQEYRTFNYQDPYTLSVAETRAILDKQRLHIMRYSVYLN